MWHPMVIALLSTALIVSSTSVSALEQESPPSELRRLVTLSRHGSRAPNGVIERICPNNIKNLKLYSVPEEQLTQYGMQQLVNVGEHIRNVYTHDKKFLSSSLNGVNHSHFETYFRSDAATRCGQSAISLGYGLYPDGTGPPGFPKQPLPVTMQLVQNEHEFAAPKGPCKRVLIEDMIAYANTRAPELLAQYNETIRQMGKLCGVDLYKVPTMPGGEDIVLTIKDIADMLIFDRQNKLEPLAGVTSDLSDQLEKLAFTNLMERYYSTDRTITYWNGGFPTLLHGNLNGAANTNSPSSSQYRYYSYHGHRELLHGLGKMLGWTFQFEGLPSALGMTSLHPGTTMFFELHARKNATGEEYFVKTYNYSPNTKREQVTLEKCSSADCPLEEFNAIIQNHIKRTGTWEEICKYEGAANTKPTKTSGEELATPVKDEADKETGWFSVTNGSFIVVTATLCAALVFGVVKAIVRMRNFRRREVF